MLKINLQLLADAGTLVNATGNYVNAYTGATEAFAGANSLDPTLKAFYDTELLENARTEMFYAQFGKKQALPARHKGVVEWRKWNTFARADKLQEGVIPTGQKFGITSLTGAVNQYGTYTAITDILELRAYDPVILGATEEMGASAAETQEALTRDALMTGTNVLYCDLINTTSNNAYVSTPTTQNGLKNAAASFSLLTPDMVNKARTKMRKDKVPTINGKYYAVIHPSVAYDLRSSDEWIEVHKYAAVGEIFNGEIGELHGIRFIENTFAPVLVGDGLAASARYLTLAGAFAAVTDQAATAGEAGASYATIDETPTDDLVGRMINIDNSGTLTGPFTITGINASSKYVFVKETTTAGADGYYLVPGEGGYETKTGGAQVAVYATFIFGKDGFGIIDPEGGALEMIVKDKSEIGGPLNQFSTIGYKFETNGATILYPERVLRVMSCSAYSGTDAAN
ncbi:MAG: N4-gp56 family major capsid protein [Clostridia bacterium]|nr:N4-gp56 family major capsid protein [Clostridia bacterium]